MPTPLSGPGVGLPLPQYLYPTALQNAPIDSPTNKIGLAPGDQLPIPAGTWYIGLGNYTTIEFLDPVTNTWIMSTAGSWTGGWTYIKSDGFTVRLANRTGCPVSASVTAYGTGWVQSSTTIAAVGSTSTWLPIVGGQLSASVTSTQVGGGYGIAPLVLIPAPPPAAANANGVGGIQATAWATITNGTVTTVSFSNPGAGYQSGFTLALLPNPSDPNLSTGITMATVILTTTGAGSITGALCTNPGAPITPGQMTLTLAGAGSSATIVPNVLQTMLTASIVGSLITAPLGTVAALLTTVGGSASVGTITNSPEFNNRAFRPRPTQASFAVTGIGTVAAQVGTIYDGGLFLTTPNPVLVGNLAMPSNAIATVTNAGTLVMTWGGAQDFVTMQPAP